jgi:fatty acid desaturase
MFKYIAIAAILAASTDALNVGPRGFAAKSVTSRVLGRSRPLAVAIPLDIPIAEPQVRVEETQKSSLAPEDQWIESLDYDAFAKDVSALGKDLLKETGDKDVEHLQKIVGWRNIAAMVGLASVWATPNPITIAALSTWTYASWTMIAHHTCHGGYNRVDAGRFNSRGFGLGLVNRFVDWLDWMQPEAWNVEHNRLHHYRLNEAKDPDLVQRNLEFLQADSIPVPLRYLAVMLFMPIWKWFYYAPNTYKELKISEWAKAGKPLPEDFDAEEAATVVSLFDPRRSALRKLMKPQEVLFKVMGPLFFGRYVVIPALLCAIPGFGPTLAGHALVNLVLAELLTNVHSFVTIVTNHAGDDMYTFDDAVKPKTGSFYVRQIIGSVNYSAGTDAVDFSHGWLNYQIEHHVWPDLSMLQYQLAAPRLKAMCAKHGVPYVQENVFERLRKTVDIMVGKTKMRTFPTQYEPARDKAGAMGITWKSTNGAIDAE